MRHPWRSLALLPALRVFLLLAFGIMLQWRWPVGTKLLLVLTASLLAAAALLTGLERRYRTLTLPRDVALAPLLVFAGMLRCGEALGSYSTGLLAYADTREYVLLRGTVVDDPRVAPDRQRFLLDASRLMLGADTKRVRGRVLCRYGVSAWLERDTLLALRAGDVVELRCRLRVPRPPRNPAAFDARTWVLQEGASLQASVSKGADLRILARGRAPWWKLLVSRVRAQLRGAMAALYAPAHAAVMNGLVLGDRSGIDEEMLDDFRRSGIMHILAVSGLHAGIVLSLVFVPLERLRFSLRAVIALAVLWLYAAVTGFAPPVTRAALMATVFLGGTLVQRAGSGVNTLSAAGVVIVLIDPLAFFGLSFQLSFGAVLGILLFSDRIEKTLEVMLPARLRGGATKFIVGLLALTLAAQALTLPLLAANFGQISLSGLLTNLVAVPLVFVVVTCGILSILVYAFWPACAALFAATAGGALDIVILSSDILASVPMSVIDVPSLPAGAWILYLACIAYLAATQGRVRQKFALVALLIVTTVVCGTLFMPPSTCLRVTFFDVGQGDAILIEIPGQAPWLIDTGPGDARMNSGTMVILPALRAAGIRRLGALVITHPDNDHAGGAASVLTQLLVDSVYVSCTWPWTGEAGSLKRVIARHAGGMRDLRSGDCFTFGDIARLYVLSPPAEIDCTPSNEHSVVLMLVYGKTRFLLTGDADIEAERRMVARYGCFLAADLLKVGHHGSKTSCVPEFVVAVHPRHAVITAGRNNRFKHPRPDVVARLLRTGARVHRTDIEGAVVFESDGFHVRKLPWSH